MVSSRTLHYLDEVARAGSIRKAAERLNVSATAVNKQILLLERALETPLFQRLPRTMRLTAAGEIMVEHARRTLKDYKRTELRIDDIKGLRGGEVTIATMNGLAGGVVPRVVAAFTARHRRVRVTSRVLFIPDIVKAIVDGDADIGFAYNLPRDARLDVVASFPAPLGLVVAPTHPLASRPRIRLNDCASYPTILADPTMLLHETVSDALRRVDVPVEPAFQSNSIEFMKFLAASGDGIAFLSRYDVAEEIAAGTLVHLDTRSTVLAENRLSITCRAKGKLSGAASLLVEALATHLKSA